MEAANGPLDKNCYVWCAECPLSREHALSVSLSHILLYSLTLSLVLALTGHPSLVRMLSLSLSLSLSHTHTLSLEAYGVDA